MDTSAILREVGHRPWPLPEGPWIMTQSWHELLFAHWPIAPEVLRSVIPPALPLDTFEGQGWIGVVPFRASHVVPRGVPPVPVLSRFAEINVRTYVTVDGQPGVYFFSLDAANPLAVITARLLFHLPYFNADMRCLNVKRQGDDDIRYWSHRTHRNAPPADFVAAYRPAGPVYRSSPGTLEHWLTERYCLYTVVRGDQLYRCDIHHHQWPLQSAEWEVLCNTMALAHSVHLPDTMPLLHYAHQLDVLFWPLRRQKKNP